LSPEYIPCLDTASSVRPYTLSFKPLIPKINCPITTIFVLKNRKERERDSDLIKIIGLVPFRESKGSKYRGNLLDMEIYFSQEPLDEFSDVSVSSHET